MDVTVTLARSFRGIMRKKPAEGTGELVENDEMETNL